MNDTNNTPDDGNVTGASPVRNVLRIIVAVVAIGVIIACAINIYGKLNPSTERDDDHTPPAKTPAKPKQAAKPAAKPAATKPAATQPAASAAPAPSAATGLKKAQVDNLTLLVFEELGEKVDMLSQMPQEAASVYSTMLNVGPRNDTTPFPVIVMKTVSKEPTNLDLDVVAKNQLDRYAKTHGDKKATSEIRKLTVDGKEARLIVINANIKTGPVIFSSLLIAENPTTTWIIQAHAFNGKDPTFPAKVTDSVHFVPPAAP